MGLIFIWGRELRGLISGILKEETRFVGWLCLRRGRDIKRNRENRKLKGCEEEMIMDGWVK